MATVTVQLAQFEDGTCTWFYDYNDASFKLLAFRCINDSAESSYGQVRAMANSEPVSAWYPEPAHVVAPGEHFSVSVPQAVANQFNIGIDSRGRLTNIDHRFGMQQP